MSSLRRLLPALVLIVMFAVVLVPAAAASEPADEFSSLLAEERRAAGVPPLRPSPELEAEAAAHSAVMAAQRHLHHNPNLRLDTTRWRTLSENVGVGPLVGPLHRAFMDSPAHRANVLGDWTHFGIGAVADDAGVLWVTVVFATAAPTQSPVSVGLVDPATGIWHLRFDTGEEYSFYYGNPGDAPFVGDWDCDGVATPGLYRRSDGFVYLRNSNTAGIADLRFYFGDPGDVPLAGDFDGDGCDTVSLYRPGQSTVYVMNRLGSGDRGIGAADWSYDLPGSGMPVAGDFDGDGVDTVVGAPDGSVAADWLGTGADSIARYEPVLEVFAGALSVAAPRDAPPGWAPIAGSFR